MHIYIYICIYMCVCMYVYICNVSFFLLFEVDHLMMSCLKDCSLFAPVSFLPPLFFITVISLFILLPNYTELIRISFEYDDVLFIHYIYIFT